MQNDIEKLGAMIIGGEDEERFWVLVDKVIEHRSKINELIEFTEQRTKDRNEQIESIHAEIRDLKRELMEYHNLLMKQKVIIKELTDALQIATEASQSSENVFRYYGEAIKKINKKLGIPE